MARRDVSVFAVLILIISTGVGATFSLMLARFNRSLNNDFSRSFARPIFTPVWSLVGFFNEIDLPEETGAEDPTRVLMPFLLFLYLVAVIVLVNLLIAAMAETYQRVKESSVRAPIESRETRAGRCALDVVVAESLSDPRPLPWRPPSAPAASQHHVDRRRHRLHPRAR